MIEIPYPWHLSNINARYVTTEPNGLVTFWEWMPLIGKDGWKHNMGSYHMTMHKIQLPKGVGWQDSLRTVYREFEF